LSDVIHDVSPEDTPFYSACAKTKARNTYHEWQTDALRASAANAHIEGSETVENAVIIPGTDEGLDKAGRAKEMALNWGALAA